jgi:hypothetical protein
MKLLLIMLIAILFTSCRTLDTKQTALERFEARQDARNRN